MKHAVQLSYADQQHLVAALQDSHLYSQEAKFVRLIETHISWVLIVGKYAYKIKKALNLGFLDFSNLQARQSYCTAELRLNHRLAPNIYLDVIPIGGNPLAPIVGGQPAIEYAVRMNSFNPENQLDLLLARAEISRQQMDELASTLASFHNDIPQANTDAVFGTPASIRAIAHQNLKELLALPLDKSDIDLINNISKISETAYLECRNYFNQRRRQGFIRECHGDLHLGNIVLIGNCLVPFDAIEFNPALRWIDVIDDVAFLVMDLLNIHRPDMAFRFLNVYLEQTGDYAGIAVLSFYIAYRAVVRAKIFALRASQINRTEIIQLETVEICRNYLALANQVLSQRRPSLMITHGLPGSGKSTFAQAALEKYQAIRIRSDVERKRLYGLKPLDNSHAIKDNEMYSSDTTIRTYNHLHELAKKILSAGYSVIVDAAFLKKSERDLFLKLALNMSVPFAIISIKATAPTLASRILLRRNMANDASEADLNVLEKLQTAQEILLPDELEVTVELLNENDKNGISADNPIWLKLDSILGKTAGKLGVEF